MKLLIITTHSISHPKNRFPEEPMGEAVGLSGLCSSSLKVPTLPSRPQPWHASQARPIPASELIARFQAYSPSLSSTASLPVFKTHHRASFRLRWTLANQPFTLCLPPLAPADMQPPHTHCYLLTPTLAMMGHPAATPPQVA